MNLPAGKARQNDGAAAVDVVMLVTAAVLLASYVLLRFDGRSGEGDGATAAQMIQAMLKAGRLLPPDEPLYPNGYGYQALGVFSTQVGGLSLSSFQTHLSVLLAPWIVLPAWMLYRELTGTARGATLATTILLIQPEFLFPIMRGTHEKFTRGLMLVAFYLFAKSSGCLRSSPRLAGYVLAFYLAAYGMIAFNSFFAFSFVAALLLALALLAALRWRRRRPRPGGASVEGRLRLVVATATLIAFLFVFFVYPPAQHDIHAMRNLWDRLAALLLDVERSAIVDPYASTVAGWVNGPIYLILTSADWVLLAAATALWVRQTLYLLRHREHAWPSNRELLWALCGAFALQCALSVVLDLTGGLGSNLQLRLFPSFALVAAPLIARTAAERLGRAGRRAGWAIAVAALSVLSVLKATNEPLVANKWTFHTPAEMRALNRAGVILADRSVWTEFDERLLSAQILRDPQAQSPLQLDAWSREPSTRDVLVSDVTRARAARLSAAAPIEGDSLITYDNGRAQIYHLRPRTPFQR